MSEADNKDWREALSHHLGRLEDLAAKLPGGKLVVERIKPVRELLLDQRPPRFVLVGRRGSGKSSLVNALFSAQVAVVGHEGAQTGKAEWFTFKSERGSVEILDTRGFQEGSRPEGADDAPTAIASVLAALDSRCPDAILFLVKAKEADAAIDSDLEALEKVCAAVKRRHGAMVPFVAVLTQCDELEPKSVQLHEPERPGQDPADLREKFDRVQLIEHKMREKLSVDVFLRDRLARVIGVSAYQSWRRDGSVREDARWQIELLVEYLLRELPGEARVELVRLSMVKKLQKELATTLVHAVAGACATVALSPVPIADLMLITPLQAAMITGIAYIGGRSVDARGVRDFFGAIGVNVGAGFVLREAARALVKLVPVAGEAVSAGVAYAGTVALGSAAIAYFIENKNELEAKQTLERVRNELPRDSGVPRES